jgi:hypothetical protein
LATKFFWLPNLVTKKLGNQKNSDPITSLIEKFWSQKEMVDVHPNG